MARNVEDANCVATKGIVANVGVIVAGIGRDERRIELLIEGAPFAKAIRIVVDFVIVRRTRPGTILLILTYMSNLWKLVTRRH